MLLGINQSPPKNPEKMHPRNWFPNPRVIGNYSFFFLKKKLIVEGQGISLLSPVFQSLSEAEYC